MVIKDRIYGSFDIDSPILLELLNSEEVLRLKNISQLGVPDKYFHNKGFSRYEHSVGVMLLLKKLGASEKEQVAGLLHDVSHTVFSHVIDWVFGDTQTEGFQDSKHEDILSRESLSSILEKYGYNYKEIADLESFHILDTPIPNLCVDRIDYSLRQSSPSVVKSSINSLLLTEDEKIIFKSFESAKTFAEHFLDKQVYQWGSSDAALRYAIFSRAIKDALDEGVMTEEDFWLTEDIVLEKIEKGGKNVQKWLNILNEISFENMPKSNQVIHKKFRYVDPEFKEGNHIYRLSLVDKEFNKRLLDSQKENSKGIQTLSVLAN